MRTAAGVFLIITLIIILCAAAAVILSRSGKREEEGTVQRKKSRGYLEQELLGLRRELWEIERKKNYARFMENTMHVFQILMGLPGGFAHMPENEKRNFYIENIVGELRGNLARFHGEIIDGRLCLPETQEEFDAAGAAQEIYALADGELNGYLDRARSRINSGRMQRAEQEIASELGSVMEKLLEGTFPPTAEVLEAFAGEIKGIMEKHGIYPMLSTDIRLADYPALRQRFLYADNCPVEYPGLFLQRNGKTEVFGAYVGTRRR